MGSSLIQYGGIGIWSHDETIQIWLGLLIQELDAVTNLPEWTQSIRQQWEASATYPGMGCSRVNFDEYVVNVDRANWLISVCANVQERLNSYQGWIPKDVLNTLHQPDGIYYTEYRYADDVVSLGNDVIKLLRRELSPDHNDPRWIVKIKE